MKLIKIEVLVEFDNFVLMPSEAVNVMNALIEAVFRDNSHIGKLIVCESKLIEDSKDKKHEWLWFMNGIFCINCNSPIGTPEPCKP